jgi:DNA mismatch repair ATPase MutL
MNDNIQNTSNTGPKPIRRLQQSVINRIAAGEVCEAYSLR